MENKEREILQTRRISNEHEVILVKRNMSDGDHEYVTWMRRIDSPEDTFWGHYFDHDLNAATRDFKKRG